MPLNLFYTMVQKSQKWPKTQIKGGPALKEWFRLHYMQVSVQRAEAWECTVGSSWEMTR